MRSPSCWLRAAAPRRGCWTWPGTWKSGCPAPRRRSGPGRCGTPRRRSSPGLPPLLDPGEARAAEEKVLGRAGRLTPGGLRSAIARAVMEVAPDKARKRREDAEKDARVQRWAEDSGNAALAGRELPPAEVLAADQRISWWARQLKKAGLAGSMDELRARAYLDLLLDKDSRPTIPAPASDGRDRRERRRREWRRSGGRAGGRRAGAPGSGGSGGSGRAQDCAGGGGAAGRVRRAAAPDRPAGHLGGAGGPAGGDPGAGPGRPVAGPGPGPRRRREPRDHLVPDRHRPARTRDRARLRPAGTQEP